MESSLHVNMSKPSSGFWPLFFFLIIGASPGPVLVAQELPSATLTFPEGTSTVEIPMEVENYRAFISVEIEGAARPLRMILDSGAPVMVLAKPELLQENAYPVFAQAVVDGIGEEEAKTVPLMGAVSARIGPLSLGNGLMLLGGLADYPAGFDGVIGRSVFDNAVVELDWEQSVVRLHAPESFEYLGDGAILPLEPNGSRHLVTRAEVRLSSSEKRTLSLMVDTGAGQALGLVLDDDQRASFATKLVKDAVVGWGSRGPQRGAVGRLAAIQLGRFELKDVVTSFVDDSSGGADGWLGLAILSRFHLFFDVVGGRLILEPSQELHGEFRFNSTGLMLEPFGPGQESLRVFDVLENSPAAVAGLAPEDRIVTIDGSPVAQLTSHEVSQLLVRPPEGRVVKIELSREGRISSIRLKAKRLL